MTRAPVPPAGFAVADEGRCRLIARPGDLDELRRHGLVRAEGWRERLTGRSGATGRGGAAVLELAPGRPVRLKQLRRGGLAALLWRDRFAGTGRLLANLTVPLEAARRGVATPDPVALLVAEDLPGLFLAWLAVSEVEGAEDLVARFASDRPPTRPELQQVLRAVRRMHDLGLEHRDLNLGNLMLASAGREAEPSALVVDLDRARLHPGPLPFRVRQRALRRLERSYVKCGAPATPAGDVRDLIYALYAGEDATLAGRLEKGRSTGRLWIRLHRFGWRG